MIAPKIESPDAFNFTTRPKRLRHDSPRHFRADGCFDEKTLEIHDVMRILQTYDSYGGGINCSVCGKLYKSRVCFIKHLWEHSIYWDQFDGVKNHDRVLSIQAALILYSGHFGRPSSVTVDPLMGLLVTGPNDKKEELFSSEKKQKTPKKNPSPLKRKRSCDM